MSVAHFTLFFYFCAIMKIEEIYSRFKECSGVTTDSQGRAF